MIKRREKEEREERQEEKWGRQSFTRTYVH